MTRRGGREASERRSGIGEDERQPVKAFQFDDIGNALRKETIRVKHKWEGAEEKLYTKKRGTPYGP